MCHVLRRQLMRLRGGDRRSLVGDRHRPLRGRLPFSRLALTALVSLYLNWTMLRIASSDDAPGKKEKSAGEPTAEKDPALIKARQLLGGIALEAAGADGKWSATELVKQPVFRFGDPTREHGQGTLWVWGSSGRPVAAVECFQWTSEPGRWTLVMNNLSGGRIRGQRTGRAWWRENQSAVETKPLPKSETPGPSPRSRLLQMKDLSRRFQAHEFWDPDNSRYELRLLTQPVHRYEDDNSGLIDGAFFVFANGTNPEVGLLIEALRSKDGVAQWHYAAARVGNAELHLSLDGEEAWKAPPLRRLIPPDEPYWFENWFE